MAGKKNDEKFDTDDKLFTMVSNRFRGVSEVDFRDD